MESLLITPIQRLPRVKMLLEEMLACTNKADPEKQELTKAVQQIAAVTQRVSGRSAACCK